MCFTLFPIHYPNLILSIVAVKYFGKLYFPTLFLATWDPQLKERGYDTVLPDQGYHTSQAVVIDESGAMVEGWLMWGNRRNLEKDLFQYHLVHHGSHVRYTGLNPGLCVEEAVSDRLTDGHASTLYNLRYWKQRCSRSRIHTYIYCFVQVSNRGNMEENCCSFVLSHCLGLAIYTKRQAQLQRHAFQLVILTRR